MKFIVIGGMSEYKNHQKILTPIPADFDVPLLRNERLGYHYTGIEKLKSIVESRQLWFSSLADVNDSAEIADGVAVFTDFIRKRTRRDDWKSDLWENLRKETIEGSLATHFVFCLTLDEDSLPMWSLYAGNTDGCCIGFNYSNLIDSLLIKNFELLKGGQFSFGFMVYNRNEKIRIFKTFLKACGNAAQSSCAKFFNKEIEEVPIKSPMWPESFHYYENSEDKIRRFSNGFPDFAFFKNRTFRYENELRIVVRIPRERQEDLEKLGKIRKDGNKRFLCLDFDLARSVKRIYSAPKAPQILREEILMMTKTVSDLRNVRIWASSSTIR